MAPMSTTSMITALPTSSAITPTFRARYPARPYRAIDCRIQGRIPRRDGNARSGLQYVDNTTECFDYVMVQIREFLINTGQWSVADNLRASAGRRPSQRFSRSRATQGPRHHRAPSRHVLRRPRRRDGRFDDHTDYHACRFATEIQYSLSAPWVRSPRHPGGGCGADEPKRPSRPSRRMSDIGLPAQPVDATQALNLSAGLLV